MAEIKETKNQSREEPLITVVVPIYNMQDYLTPCLNSIRQQHYQNLEILLVDDGSVDDSAKICRTFCAEDSRFRLTEQENQGLGPARNTGLKLARGKYICFVDADDLLHPDFVRILYENLIKTKADLSICRFYSFEGENDQRTEVRNEVQVLDQMGLLRALLKEDPETIMVAWNKLVSVDWLKGFRFENKWHEDQFMINEYIKRCKKAVITSAPLYAYRKRSDSIMGKENQKDLRHLDDLEAREQRIEYFYQPEYRAVWKDLFLADLKIKISWYVKLYSKENKALLHRRICPSYASSFKRYLRIGGLFRKNGEGARLILFRISPRLYVLLRKQLRKSVTGTV